MVSCVKKFEDAFWDLKLPFVTLKQPSSKVILSKNSTTFEVVACHADGQGKVSKKDPCHKNKF